MAKRIMCIIISVLMIVSLLPTGAFADSSGDTDTTQVADSSTSDADSETMDEEDSSNNKGGGTDETEDAEESISLTSANDGESIVATVGEVSYTSLSEAISAANGSAVVLQSDVTLTASSDYSNELYISSGTVVIDLNGHNIDGGSITYPIYVASGATLTISDSSSSVGTITLAGTYGIYCLGTLNITGGNISSSSSSAAIYVYGGTLNMTGGSVTTSSSTGVWLNNATSASLSDCTIKTTYSGWGYAVYCSSCTGAVSLTNVTIDASSTNCCGLALLTYTEATLTNCSIHTNGWYCIANNGADSKVELTINGGTYIADDCTALYLPNYNATTTISNATITGACGIEIRGGTLTLTDCTVTGNNSSYIWQSSGSGNTVYGPAIAISQHTTKQNISVTINGGTYSATNAPAVAQLNLNSATSEDVSKISLSVSSGSFTGYSEVEGTDTAIELASVETSSSSEDDVTGMTVSISGGTYSSDVSEYVASGYAYDSTTGTVTTAQVASVTSSDGTTTTTYSTLVEAFAAAGSGDTITLLSDVTVTDGEYSANGLYQVSTDVTLDLDKYTLTVDTTRVFGVLNGGSLTVKNGTVKIADNATATGNQFNILRGTCSFTAEDVTFDGNNIAANFLHVASGGTATIALTNCNITNQSGGVVVYDNDGNSTVTLTGCNYATNPSGGALNNIANFKIVFNSNNQITSESTNWEASNALRYTYTVAEGGSVAADLTLATTKGAASLTVEGGSVTGTITVPSGTSMTVSGGTVSGTITTSGTFTMTGGTVTASSGASQAVLVKGGTVNISGGTISASSSRALVFDTDVTVSGTISGGTFIGSDIALLARSSSGNTVSVTGGTYTASKGIDLVASILADGYGVFDTEGNPATVSGNYYMSSLDDNTVTISTGVAKIEEIVYGTLQAAIDAASENDEVDLLTNVSEDIVVATGKTITLDLNGYELTNVDDHTITVEIGATLTINDSSEDKTGKVDNLTHAKAAIYNNGTVTLNGGEYTRSNENGKSDSDNGGNSFYVILNHGTMTINSGVKVTQDGAYSSMIENGYQSYYSGNASSGYIAGTNAQYPSLTINGGTFYGGLNTIKNDDGGYLTINGGTFTNVSQNVVLNWNDCTITGGDFTHANGTLIYSSNGSNADVDTGKLTISGGTFTGVSLYYIVYSVNTDGTNISGGTYSVSDSGNVYITQSTSNYAENYAPTATDDGKYTVVKAVATVTSGTTVTSYATLSEALSAATDGSTVTLLDDVTVSADLTASAEGTVTIDLGGNNLTINSDATLTVASAATVTIVDTAETGGLVTNNGTIAVEGTLDIRDLGYTTDSSGSGLLGQLNGKITLGASSTFIVPDVWNTMWGSVWEPTWNSAANIMSAVTAGARVISFGKVWECTTGFSNLTTYNDSGDSYWSATGTYLVEYFKTDRGGSGISEDDKTSWTYPTSDDSNMIFAGWYSDSTYGSVYTETSGEATAKFVKLFYDKTTAEDGEEAAVINFIGGSLRKDSDETTSTSLRFGYEIIAPYDFITCSWSWEWSGNDSSGTVKGQYYSSTTILSNEDIGTDKIRTNLVITDIPSTAYSTNFNSTLIVKFVTGDGTTVEAKSSTSTRTVDGVAYAVINDSDADDDDQSYAESIYKVTHTDYSGSNS